MARPSVRLLLIEDDEDDVVLVRDLLAEVTVTRFAVEWARDPEDGLARLSAGGWDACLVDYRLGAKDGVELVRAARARGSRTPIILLTGQASHEIDLAAMQAGADDFLDKQRLSGDLLERSIRYAVERRAAEEARGAHARTEAESQAKDRFLAMLSHELRTPLAPVLAVASRLEHDERLSAEVRADLALVRRNVEHEARLIDDLLDLTRVAQGKLELRPEEVDAHDLLEGAIATCCRGPVEAGRLALETDLAAARHTVRADPPRLTQVFCNLLANAIKFTPEGGAVAVRSRVEPGGPRPLLAVEVADTGVGIPADVLPRIFEPFEQGHTASRADGLGLGLAISRAIVESHGGALTAASAGPGRGSVFTVRLPLSAATAAPDRRAEEERTPAAAGRPLTLLLVEDHADTATAMADLLRAGGHRVEVAGSVGEALAAARAVTGRGFDVVVSDLSLPDGSGLDLMRELKRRGLKGIALSGHGMEEDVRNSREAGFDRHLLKPVDPRALVEALHEVAAAGPPGRRAAS